MTTRAQIVISLWVCGTALAGCGGRSRSPSPQTAAQAQALAAADSALASPTPAAPARQAPASLAGSWALRTEDPTRRGPLLELAIDSVTGSVFQVRVAFFMSGNVGIDPARFEARAGTVSPDGVVRFSLKMREQAEPLAEMSGTMGRDTIRLHTFRWAGEDQTAGRTRWLLVRQAAP